MHLRLLPILLLISLSACASPRPPAPVPAVDVAEPLDPAIRPLSQEMEAGQ